VLQAAVEAVHELSTRVPCLFMGRLTQDLVHYEECPQQADCISCGLFTVCNGALIAMGSAHRADIDTRSKMALARETIAKTLVMISSSEVVIQACSSLVPADPEESKQMTIDLWRNLLSSISDHKALVACPPVMRICCYPGTGVLSFLASDGTKLKCLLHKWDSGEIEWSQTAVAELLQICSGAP